MVKTWKSSWSNYVKTLTSLQEQGQKMLDLYFSQAETAQNEAKKVLQEGLKNAQDAQTAYIKAVEDNLKKFEEMVAPKKGK
jgi:polyhydroxyalkanoate synthesis regulator phasin